MEQQAHWGKISPGQKISLVCFVNINVIITKEMQELKRRSDFFHCGHRYHPVIPNSGALLWHHTEANTQNPSRSASLFSNRCFPLDDGVSLL